MPYNLSIPGQMSEWELRAIEAVAALVPAGGTIVEIGSLFGRSSWAWAKSAAPDVTVCCIDPWEGNEGIRPVEQAYGITYGIDQFRTYTADCPNVKPLRGYSPDDFQGWDRPVDLFFEDSVHADPVLSRNLDFWGRRLTPTGIACGHDYRPRFPDVVNGVDALARRLGREVLVVDMLWCLLPPASDVPAVRAVKETLLELAAEARADALTRPYAHSFQVRNKPAAAASGMPVTLDVYACNESRQTWTDGAGTPAAAHVAVSLRTGGKEVAGALLPLPPLQPDRPVTASLTLLPGPLAPGACEVKARLVLTGADGAVLRTFDPGDLWTLRIDAADTASAALPPAYRVFQTDRPKDFDQVGPLDVHAAYRMLLGRPPDSPAQVAGHLQAAADLPGLRRRFMGSPEFRQQLGGLPVPPATVERRPAAAPEAGRRPSASGGSSSVLAEGFWMAYEPLCNGSGFGIRTLGNKNYEITNPSGARVMRSMLEPYEIAMVYALAKDHFSGHGSIVDLGCLLGIGSNAFAKGLRDNKAVTDKRKKIHCFDLFLDDGLSAFLGGETDTGSFFDEFLGLNRDYLDNIAVSPGDIMKLRWSSAPIEILFIDAAKTWDLNTKIVRQFFKSLVPGLSIVVQQDWVHWHEYWIHLTMEHFAEHFEPVECVYGASAVFKYVKEIPAGKLDDDLRRLPLSHKEELFERVLEKAAPSERQVLKCAYAAMLVDEKAFGKAGGVLDSVDVTVSHANPWRDFSGIARSNLATVRNLLHGAVKMPA